MACLLQEVVTTAFGFGFYHAELLLIDRDRCRKFDNYFLSVAATMPLL